MNAFKITAPKLPCVACFIRTATWTTCEPTAMGKKVCFYFLLLGLFAGVLPHLQAQLITRPFVHNGYKRPYLIYKPANLPPHPAVVFMLGGIDSTAVSESKEFGWIPLANQYKFLAVFPDPVATYPNRPAKHGVNITFWELKGSRTHHLAPGMQPVDDEGYLLGVLHDVIQHDHPDPHRLFWAGFSSGSGMVQLFASRHPKDATAITAVATALLDPPEQLAKPISVLYIHGDKDEQFIGFQTHSPNFATTPQGNWVTWGYLDGCRKQTARKVDWGVQFRWKSCPDHVRVIADFVAGLGHEWPGSTDSDWNQKHRPTDPLNATDMAWRFFASSVVK